MLYENILGDTAKQKKSNMIIQPFQDFRELLQLTFCYVAFSLKRKFANELLLICRKEEGKHSQKYYAKTSNGKLN